MVFSKLIYSDKGKSPRLLKSEIKGSIVGSFATLKYEQTYQTLENGFYELYINCPEGCVIYNIKVLYSEHSIQFSVNPIPEGGQIIKENIDRHSNSDAITLHLGTLPSLNVTV